MEGTPRARHPSYRPCQQFEDQEPLTVPAAAAAVTRCVATAAHLLARDRVHLPRGQVGLRIHFGDGTVGRVYRETVVDGVAVTEPCLLVVAFRLKAVRGVGHRIFEVESLLNTVLFVGFPGFVSKLWLAADERGVYRGVYGWDGPSLADAYARALWRVLALVSAPDSIHYRVVPGLRPHDVLADPTVLERVLTGQPRSWWWVTSTS